MKINFKCKCGGSIIEEVLNDVTQYSTISEIEKLPNTGAVAVAYDELTNTEYGELSHYQCMNCGEVLETHGIIITTPEELYELLETNNMLEKFSVTTI